MLRQLYIFILLAHPGTFKYRFGMEMLSIYDEAAKHGSTVPLLADGVRSLARQWVHPYEPAPVARVAGGPSVPMFQSVDQALPRRHLMAGATFTLVLFSALMITISMGGRSVGIMFRPLLSRPHVVGVMEDMADPVPPVLEGAVATPTTGVVVTPPDRFPVYVRITRFNVLYPLFSFRVLDRNRDTMLFDWEMELAPAMLRTLDRDGDGSLSRSESYLMLTILDLDHNGIISDAEIEDSTAVLRDLDADGDGVIVAEEMIAAVLATLDSNR